MYVLDNPVLQRELLVNLRMKRAFALLLVYQVFLAVVVLLAWPRETRLEANAESARNLVNMFFLGQYILASLMAPSFAASAITGEKERKTYEMLLSSPVRPSVIVFGKLAASLAHLLCLVIASLPIVMLCLPLGGVSPNEVLAAYTGLLTSVILFGMISIACSSYFLRTSAALVASYLLILPLALIAVLTWRLLEDNGAFRFFLVMTVFPVGALAFTFLLFRRTSARMLYPPDVGSEGKEVVDLETEAREVVGLVIQRDQFPDKLFAPPKRDDLMPDGTNAVYDKEVHSEIFSQGTLMLRVVIQVSMLLSLPIMAVCLFIVPRWAAWYMSYVLAFNMLVGPVFSAGTLTSERERQTLDLLLTTTISPWDILWGKLLAGLRVSSVLTFFLAFPLVLAAVLVPTFWMNLPVLIAYALTVLITCLTTAMLGLFCSVVFNKTTISLMTTYAMVVLLFFLPPAASVFADIFYSDTSAASYVRACGFTSPFSAAFAAPLIDREYEDARATEYYRVSSGRGNESTGTAADASDAQYWTRWRRFRDFLGFTATSNLSLLGLMIWLFKKRWRVAQ